MSEEPSHAPESEPPAETERTETQTPEIQEPETQTPETRAPESELPAVAEDGWYSSKEEVALALPEWWGQNLDALYDCLTDLGGPVRLEVFRREAMMETPFGRRLLRVLRDAAEELPWLELELD